MIGVSNQQTYLVYFYIALCETSDSSQSTDTMTGTGVQRKLRVTVLGTLIKSTEKVAERDGTLV